MLQFFVDRQTGPKLYVPDLLIWCIKIKEKKKIILDFNLMDKIKPYQLTTKY